MEINCEQIVENYLLSKNPLYAFRFPLSLLISIIIFGFSKAYEWSDNSYINQILIPIVVFLLSMVILDIISRLMVSKKKMLKLVQLCKIWMHEPSIKNHPILSKIIDIEEVLKYQVENFEIMDNKKDSIIDINNNKISEQQYNHLQKENVEIPISEIYNISPYPLEYNKDIGPCIDNSNNFNICSTKNNNPNKLIAPIPGPQWLPQTADNVQNNLKNNIYTDNKCNLKNS